MSPHRTSPPNPSSPLTATFLKPTTSSSICSPTASHLSSETTSLSSLSSTDAMPPPQNHPPRPLNPGIYVPTLTFFHPTSEDLDLPTISSHAVRLARAGITGLTTMGSNGEAVHLSASERSLVTRTTRSALDSAGYPRLPIIVGCGAQSVRETLQLCRDAATAGGDYALILPPSYYRGLFTPDTITAYFTEVADTSPLPVLIYNYPAAAGGLDLDSDTIESLSHHPNILGCKLTCGNTGKLARIASATNALSPLLPLPPTTKQQQHPPTNTTPSFACLGGSADFTLQTLTVGGTGVIAGLGNLCPKTCVRVFELFVQGDLAGAREVQAVLARADAVAIRGGVVGAKAMLQGRLGYGGVGRRPLPGKVVGGEKGEWEEVWGVECGL